MILKNISGGFRAGTSTAILGPSGSGKTTLLNFLSDRVNSNALEAKSELLINGNVIKSISALKHRFSYVMQDDVLYEDLTVKEQLLSTAELTGISNSEEKVDEILKWLNLEHCKDSRIGDEISRGISGGERKRTSIAVELITDPSIIFLDEPTTGLDSKSALDVAGIINMFAKKKRTVIATIHQPSSEILHRFDNVMCMCRGEIVYFGSPTKIPSHFATINYAPAPQSNPADHLMAILNDDDIRIRNYREGRTLDESKVKEEFEQRLDLFVSYYLRNKPTFQFHNSTRDEFALLEKDNRQNSTGKAFCVILKRFYKIYFRNPKYALSRIIQFTVLTTLNVLIFLDTKKPEDDTIVAIQDTSGLMYNLVLNMVFSAMVGSLFGLIPLIPKFTRDHAKRLYSPAMFYLISSLYQLPFLIILVCCYMLASCIFLDINTGDNWSFVPEWMLTLVLTYIAAMGIGDVLSVALRNVQLAMQLFPIFVAPLFLTSGFVAVVKNMVFYLFLYSYISPFRFGFQSTCLKQYEGGLREHFLEVCTIRPNGCFDKSCAIKQPGNIACDPFNSLDFVETSYWLNIGILCIQILAYRLLSAFIFTKLVKDVPMKESEIPDESTFNPKLHKRDESAILSKFYNNVEEEHVSKVHLQGKI